MSEVKVNKISPRTNCGTVQLGDSGDTITIPAGATITNNGTQTGFGRTGTVNWDTSSIKTATFTAVNGEGYFCNTTGGAFTVNLPSSPSGGNIVAIKDYAQTFSSNNITVGRGGSPIEGVAQDVTLDGAGESVTFVYVDGTKGWLLVNESTTQYGQQFVTATGGTVATSGDFKIHTFTGPGTFCVSNGGNSEGSNTVDYLVIGGGGAGGTGSNNGGGGGAGGYRFSDGTASGCYAAGPAPLSASALPVTAQAYPIVVGAGAPAPATSPNTIQGANGSNSSFSSITSAGGGGGGSWNHPITGDQNGNNGGSGGGSANPGASTGGCGNNPPVSPPQGNPGGQTAVGAGGAGGGGIGGNGGAGACSTPAGDGGAGLSSSINGTPTARGGGGGGGYPTLGGAGQASAGGGAGTASPNQTANATSGTINTGGGGGGNGNPPGIGGAGGSGIVIIRYKFQ